MYKIGLKTTEDERDIEWNFIKVKGTMMNGNKKCLHEVWNIFFLKSFKKAHLKL